MIHKLVSFLFSSDDAHAVIGGNICSSTDSSSVQSQPISHVGFKSATTLVHTVLAGTFHYYTFRSDAPFLFKPGQYVSVKVADDRINCYSIAGRDDDYTFHLLVNTAPGGVGSHFFENLQPGDHVQYLGPLGIFGLHLDDGSESLVFGATGSGLAPLICMIKYLLYEKGFSLPVSLYLGLTYPHEVFWQDEFAHLHRSFSNFRYSIVVLKPDEHWAGPSGFITQVIERDFPDATRVSAYLCGHPAMIADVTHLLISHGCDPHRVYTEKY